MIPASTSRRSRPRFCARTFPRPPPFRRMRRPACRRPLTGFVGRGRELDEIRDLLARSRLVTLVGVGGVGKTRLALESARRAATDLVDGVAIVDLVPVSDPDLVQAHIALALGVRELPGAPLDVALRDALRGGDMLLALDNCEHVREATAQARARPARGGA